MRIAETADGKIDQSQLLKQFADAVLFAQRRAAGLAAAIAHRPRASCPITKKAGVTTPASRKVRPVDADGNPIFYQVPTSWDAAKNDGERWRWLLETMVEWHPARRNEERIDSR